MEEGLAKFNLASDVFFNPHMELCRDFCSLVISTLQELSICDGMCGVGVRGIRYALENSNVKVVTFIDSNEKACQLTKENLSLNNLNFDVICDDFNHQMYKGGRRYNYVEIDPFGSPIPFIRSALFHLRIQKEAFLSITATDTAVLCGAQPRACQIYYGAKPINNFFCHEAGVRILIGHIARIASPLRIGIEPIFAFSKRHWAKVILKTKKGAEWALRATQQIGFVSFCPNCFKIRESVRPFLEEKCRCGANVDWAGPLWLGKILDRETLEKMARANGERNYKNKKEIAGLLKLMIEEAEGPAFYFDVHAICKKIGILAPKIDKLIESLRSRGFFAVRTAFRPHSIKTNANVEDIAKGMTGIT